MVSILGIGLLTAVIGDAASHFGCTVQLRDTVTAISIVALGTSVPGTPGDDHGCAAALPPYLQCGLDLCYGVA